MVKLRFSINPLVMFKMQVNHIKKVQIALEANIAKIINAINRVEAKTDRILMHSLSEEGSNTTNGNKSSSES